MLLGCAKQRNYDEIAASLSSQNFSKRGGMVLADIPGSWWHLFQNDELNDLIIQAMGQNPDIQQTRARLEQAAAVARRSLADLLPSASVSGDGGGTYLDGNGTYDFSLSGAALYELDIWGKNQASYRANLLEAEARSEDLRSAAITLSASVVETWVRLLATREEEAIIREQIDINSLVFDLQHKRYKNGVAPALDVLQQKEVLASAQAQLPDVLASQELLMHQLSVLVGSPPSDKIDLTDETMPPALPLSDAGIPSRLLAERPDIIAAWSRVIAADWSSAAAQRDRLPSIQLTGRYSASSDQLGSLFETNLLNLAVGLTMPLIDGGARRAEVRRAQAQADERFHTYRQTVLSAIAEVEDALTLNQYREEKLDALQRQLAASRASLQTAQISYSNGDVSYINVLNGLLNVQSLERRLLSARLDVSLARLELLRALGLRSWTDDLIKQISEDKNGDGQNG